MPKIELTVRELVVTAQVMRTLSAYTEREMREQFGWTGHDVNTWHRALLKLMTAERQQA